jgi:hypothetical protein
MKKLITILAALVISANSIIKAQDCLWAKSAGGTSYESGSSTCTDANGNVYVVGYFSSPTITFGNITLTNADNPANSYDVFIVKYSSDGTVLWAKSIGGNNNDDGSSICTDSIGNIFLTGYFQSDSITFGTTTLINEGYNDIFIAKYAPNGEVLWAKSVGGNIGESGTSICTDVDGNLYLTGCFLGPDISFGTFTLNNSGSFDSYVTKYSPDGIVLWAKSIGGINAEEGFKVSTDVNSNVYVTGKFESPALNFGTNTISNAGSIDIFIAKYAPDGTILWAKSAGGSDIDLALSISTDAIGNVYFTGYYNSSSITFGTTTLYNAGNSDLFIVKYSPDGTVLWAKSVGGANSDFGKCLSVDSDSNIYLIGHFNSPSISIDTSNITNLGDYDIFIAKYASDGTVLWAKSAGGSGSDIGNSVFADAIGNVYLTGSFYSPTITFGTTTLTNDSNSGNTGDMFIAKYSGVSTGLNEAFTNNKLKITPNPTNSSITLTMPSLKNSMVSITNLTGTKVGNYNTQNTSTKTIDVSHLANGVYFVSLKSEEGMVTKKIIKKD